MLCGGRTIIHNIAAVLHQALLGLCVARIKQERVRDRGEDRGAVGEGGERRGWVNAVGWLSLTDRSLPVCAGQAY